MTNFEQQMDFFHVIFVCFGTAALVILIMTVILFFALKIPQVFNEITGRKAKKAIEKMQSLNEVVRSTGEITEPLDIGKNFRLCQPVQSDTMVLDASPKQDLAEFRVLRTILEVHTDEVID